jgi:hypothetical protein
MIAMFRIPDMGTCFRSAGPGSGLFAGPYRVAEEEEIFFE